MKLEIKNQHISVTEREPLVSGTVSYTAEFSFDAAWDGYTPVAVFEGSGVQGKVSREAAITDGKCTVPWEVLLPGGYLRVGVYGIRDGERLPTIYTDSLFVARGAESADPAAEPTPGVIEQFVAQTAENRTAAEAAADRAEEAAIHQPYPNAETGTWWVWDAEAGAYVDSGIANAGGGGKATPWRLITSITLAEDVKSIDIDVDDAGDPFELSEIYIRTNATNISSQTDATKLSVDVNGKDLSYIGTTTRLCISCGASGKSGRNWLWLKSLNPLIVLHGEWIETNVSSGKAVYCYQPHDMDGTNPNPYTAGEKITSILLYGTLKTNFFAAGSIFEIYGR